MESPFKVTGIDHVVFHVKDLGGAKKFYIDFLAWRSTMKARGNVFSSAAAKASPCLKSKTTKMFTAAVKSITWRYAWRPETMKASKRRSKTPASKSTAAKMIRIASISTIPTAITYNF